MAATPEPIAIYRETVAAVYAFVCRRCGGDRQLAEDVTQETYLRFVTESKRMVPNPALPWLQTVARNLLLNHYRRRKPASVDPSSLNQLWDEGADVLHQGRAHAAIAWGLAQLPADSARLIDEFHLGGKSVSTIAAQSGLSERAVEGRLRRSRVALRRVLAPIMKEEN
jgi:RNA polymerase sigma-70 factor (ECF subfamily)